MKHTLTLLGSTGSIGVQALAVAKNLGYEVRALCAGHNAALLAKQAREWKPRRIAIWDASQYRTLKTMLADTDIEVAAGSEAVCALAADKNAGTVLNAIVGIAGLESSLMALLSGNTLALANKESLVAAGELVLEAAKAGKSALIPVDSEHSAIFQCLNGENRDRIKKILLTASGGPFFGWQRDALAHATAANALCHPNWSMGAKITVDSATLMNKGLELIEAMHLFGVPPDRIEILVHRQSVVHSAVEFCDGAVMAQLGAPDMAIPIQYALTWPDRLPCAGKTLSLFETGSLTFERPDLDVFECLATAMKAARCGGLAPCILSGANEAAVGLFLEGKIGFLKIGTLVRGALERVKAPVHYVLSDVYEADRAAREDVLSHAQETMR